MIGLKNLATVAIVWEALCISSAGAAVSAKTEADSIVSKYVAERRFSGTVLVTKGDTVILREAYGKADFVRGTDNTPETRFPIASLTKQFTAAAIYRLQEEGKLLVSDRLSKYFPMLSERGRAISLERLLTHTSGIPDYEEIPGANAVLALADAPVKLIELLSGKEAHLHFSAGKKFEYSNTNYALLGIVVERASGESYASYVGAMLKKAGMTDTGVYQIRPPTDKTATGHEAATKEGILPVPENEKDDLSRVPGDGGLYSTIDDLARWNRALTEGKVLRKDSRDAMLRPGKNGYASGVNVGRGHGHKILFHEGSLAGFCSYLVYLPQHDATVVVLGNIDGAPEEEIAGKLVKLLSRELEREKRGGKASGKGPLKQSLK